MTIKFKRTKRFGNVEVRVSTTNWTFGVWWDRDLLKKWGIDLGPMEIVGPLKARRV